MPAAAVPEQWPPEVSEKYEVVRNLGKGGFASVVLAKRKDPDAKPKFAAIKVVGSKDVTRQEIGYAHRELDILAELSHPNVMKLLEHWEPPVKDHRCAAILALSFHKGPTLDQLLRKGGALSNIVGRVVCAQLIDVLSYLHSRAVIHRDIKPDNLIVTGAAYEVDELWDNTIVAESQSVDWGEYMKKYTLILVDFGFARALGPDDMTTAKGSTDRTNQSQFAKTRTRSNNDLDDSINHSTSSRQSLSASISRTFHRQMSALGNRNFAAPEVMDHVKRNKGHDAFRVAAKNDDDSIHLTDTMAVGVSSYGMLADAFSAGNTIRFALTGVAPNLDINKTIAAASHSDNTMGVFSCCGGRGGKSAVDGKPSVRKRQYRSLDQIPKEAVRLIDGLTKIDEEQRTSICHARLEPWIDTVLSTEAPVKNKVDFLSFVLQEKVKKIEITEEE